MSSISDTENIRTIYQQFCSRILIRMYNVKIKMLKNLRMRRTKNVSHQKQMIKIKYMEHVFRNRNRTNFENSFRKQISKTDFNNRNIEKKIKYMELACWTQKQDQFWKQFSETEYRERINIKYMELACQRPLVILMLLAPEWTHWIYTKRWKDEIFEESINDEEF